MCALVACDRAWFACACPCLCHSPNRQLGSPTRVPAGGTRWHWTLQKRWTTCTHSWASCTATSSQSALTAGVAAACCCGCAAAAAAAGVMLVCLPAAWRRHALSGGGLVERCRSPLPLPHCTPMLISRRCSNVLLSADWRASISDLGVAQVVGGGAQVPIGYNRRYGSPEQLLGQSCTLSSDMYRCEGTGVGGWCGWVGGWVGWVGGAGGGSSSRDRKQCCCEQQCASGSGRCISSA